MADWLDGWERRPRSDSGPMVRTAGRCLLFHTMEGSFDGGVSTLDRNNNWPHLAYDPPTRRKIHAVPFSRAGKSLANKAGGVETNRWGVIQVELSGRAAETQDWPDEWLKNIAVDVVGPVQTAVGNRLHFPRFYGTDAGFTIATSDAPQRMSHGDWLAFDGICGHQHAPENDHWDPGKLDVARIVAHLGGSDSPTPPTPLGDSMTFYATIDGESWYLFAQGHGVRAADKGRASFSTATKLVVDQAEFDFLVAACQPSGVVATLKALWPRKAERAGL